MSDVAEYDPYALPANAVREPPQTFWAALRQIGPGIILAGTLVGSGELLLTTSLGAKYGFVFLWLILFSCVIKVFVQIELGRYAISSAKPTLGAINDLGGPRWRVHWILWWWVLMMLTNIFPLGAMTGTVGQSLNLAFPQVSIELVKFFSGFSPALAKIIEARPEHPWAVLTCLAVIGLLWSGRYRRIEIITTVMIMGITLLTVAAVSALQATKFPIPWPDVARGLTFSVPADGVAIAFGVFGLTGVGAAELFFYPYWCLEKGYARYAGKREPTAEWERRAKGWIRVMYLDAWLSMVVFTVATVAFYFMGATVLHPQELYPQGKDMILDLSRMFVDSFGAWTQLVFLIGAAAVLFKTLFLGTAGNARLIADFLNLVGAVHYTSPYLRAWVVHRISLLLPVVALALFLWFEEPKLMIIVGGFTQAATIPLLAAVTLYFRYRKLDRRLVPSLAWDACLWIAFVSISCVAAYALRAQLLKVLWTTSSG